MVFTMAASSFILDEGAGPAARFVVGTLLRRRFHEVARWTGQHAADTAVHSQLRATDGIDHYAGGVGRIPYFKSDLSTQRHTAERGALETDEGELAVGKPRHVVAGADVNVVCFQRNIKLAGNRLRLGYLLRSQPLPLQHVLEIGIAADVELVGSIEPHAAFSKQVGENAVQDRGADLALDVIADDGKAGLFEAAAPCGIGSDEHGDAIDEAAAGVDRLPGVPFACLLRSDGEVGNHDVGARASKYLRNIGFWLARDRYVVFEILTDAVQHRPATNDDAGLGNRGKTMRVVRSRKNRLRNVVPHLVGVDVESRRNLDVADVIAADVGVHQARNRLIGFGVSIVSEALDQGACAIAHPDNTDAHASSVLKT